MEAYLFGGPSLPAVGGSLSRGHYTVNRRDSRNALNVTHFGILLGSELSCMRVQGSTAEIFEALPRPRNLVLYLGRGWVTKERYVGKRRKNKHRTTRNHLGIYFDTFWVTAMAPESNKPCKRRAVHGFGILLMVEHVRLGKLIASSGSMSTE